MPNISGARRPKDPKTVTTAPALPKSATAATTTPVSAVKWTPVGRKSGPPAPTKRTTPVIGMRAQTQVGLPPTKSAVPALAGPTVDPVTDAEPNEALPPTKRAEPALTTSAETALTPAVVSLIADAIDVPHAVLNLISQGRHQAAEFVVMGTRTALESIQLAEPAPPPSRFESLRAALTDMLANWSSMTDADIESTLRAIADSLTDSRQSPRALG
ncbi:hypothetical protein [Paractinoplanes atraurantiacus]|uniref:Uncharacterized protein n=1 Tax=Paractinoplanes atraurantiacus TaxID=1036182 RepID=A0A285HRM9_9ACTN|nr:hypothetical protein [Actinoplanes atraurantiacus]SNY38420.1 hypothetical protein SAMN05421748_105219 [Actinoplanes atraurantiacus]